MRVDKGWEKIMNLDPISKFREDWYINFEGWREWWARKMTKTLVFPVAPVTSLKANFKKLYLTQFWPDLARSYAHIEAPGV